MVDPIAPTCRSPPHAATSATSAVHRHPPHHRLLANGTGAVDGTWTTPVQTPNLRGRTHHAVVVVVVDAEVPLGLRCCSLGHVFRLPVFPFPPLLHVSAEVDVVLLRRCESGGLILRTIRGGGGGGGGGGSARGEFFSQSLAFRGGLLIRLLAWASRGSDTVFHFSLNAHHSPFGARRLRAPNPSRLGSSDKSHVTKTSNSRLPGRVVTTLSEGLVGWEKLGCAFGLWTA